MEFETRKENDALIVKPLTERLDAQCACRFKERFSDVVGKGGRRFVLNLENVDFVDSTGLGAIVSSLKVLDADAEMTISCVKDTVMSLFKLTRMDKVFRVYAKEAEALVAMKD